MLYDFLIKKMKIVIQVIFMNDSWVNEAMEYSSDL